MEVTALQGLRWVCLSAVKCCLLWICEQKSLFPAVVDFKRLTPEPFFLHANKQLSATVEGIET